VINVSLQEKKGKRKRGQEKKGREKGDRYIFLAIHMATLL